MCVNGSLIKTLPAGSVFDPPSGGVWLNHLPPSRIHIAPTHSCGQRWTPEDFDLLCFLSDELKLPSRVVGKLMGRTGSAIRHNRSRRSQKVEHHTRNVPQDNPSTTEASKI